MEPIAEPETVQAPEETVRNKAGSDKLYRTVIVEHLRHPGGWLTNRQFQHFLNKSVQFSVSFERPEDADEKQVKYGRIELLFNSVESARNAHGSFQKMWIDGSRPVVSVDPCFWELDISDPNRRFFDVTDNSCLVFVLNVPMSADVHMLTYLLGGEEPVRFSLLPMPTANGFLQAEAVLSSPEAAEKVLAGPDKVRISDEQQETVATILSPREYKLYTKIDEFSEKKPAESAPEPVECSAGSLAPELNEDVILVDLLKLIDENRVNFAEITTKDELYELCDTVSAQYNGVPDSILKPAMGNALQRHLNKTEVHWMRQHIEELLQMWRLETMREQIHERPTFVSMETVDYKPIIEEQKGEMSKSASKRRKAARTQMGIGSFLSANRDRLILESGNVELESDDDGNVLIGGEALSFDSWARITKTKTGSGVVRANEDGTKNIGTGGLTKKQLRMARTVEGMDQDDYVKWRKQKNQERRAETKARIMRKGAEEADESGEQSKNPEGAVAAPPAVPAAKKDLDEGEIDSDEEKEETRVAKRKAAQKLSDSSGSSSSSSSSEDGSDTPLDARKRRKMRRKKERKNPRNFATSNQPSLNPQFMMIFENRKSIIAQMSPSHKAAFAKALSQIVKSNASAQ